MARTSKLTPAWISKAYSEVSRDHGGCAENTCDLGLALAHGYDAIAIVNWAESGAADGKFLKAYDKLPQAYTKREYKKQLKDFFKQMHSIDCLECGSVCRNEFETPEHCDSCAKPIRKTPTRRAKGA